MKVTALGVNSAFATGEYYNAVPLSFVEEQLEKVLISGVDVVPIEEIIVSIKKEAKLLYDAKWQSNFLLEFDCLSPKRPGKKLTIGLDFGGDIRHMLKRIGKTVADVDFWFCSHPHQDHVGGIESIALSTFFNPYAFDKKRWLDENKYSAANEAAFDGKQLPDEHKPTIMAEKKVMRKVWMAAKPGLDTLTGVKRPKLKTYFQVKSLEGNSEFTYKDGDVTWTVELIESQHIVGGSEKMPSFGLYFKGSHGKKILFPTDTLLMVPPQTEMYYKDATVIYQDTETGPKSGVHSHIDEIRKASPEIKKKLLLYHYNAVPVVDEGEFMGILKTGDVHEW
jgi:ribonuclease BN (tRNA processing enzyme)